MNIFLRVLVIALIVAALAGPAPGAQTEYSDIIHITADEGRVYGLRSNGNILIHEGKGWRVYDAGTGSKQIAAAGAVCYALKQNGNVWRRSGSTGGWEKIDQGTGAKQLVAGPSGLWVLKDNGNVWEYTAGTGWTKIDSGTGTKQMATDRLGHLYVLKNNGNVWKYEAGWIKIDEGTGAKQLSAAAGDVYVLKSTGKIWRYHDKGWSPIATDLHARNLYATATSLVIDTDNGEVWRWTPPKGAHKLLEREPLLEVAVSQGTIFILRSDNTIRTMPEPR